MVFVACFDTTLEHNSNNDIGIEMMIALLMLVIIIIIIKFDWSKSHIRALHLTE